MMSSLHAASLGFARVFSEAMTPEGSGDRSRVKDRSESSDSHKKRGGITRLFIFDRANN